VLRKRPRERRHEEQRGGPTYPHGHSRRLARTNEHDPPSVQPASHDDSSTTDISLKALAGVPLEHQPEALPWRRLSTGAGPGLAVASAMAD